MPTQSLCVIIIITLYALYFFQAPSSLQTQHNNYAYYVFSRRPHRCKHHTGDAGEQKAIAKGIYHKGLVLCVTHPPALWLEGRSGYHAVRYTPPVIRVEGRAHRRRVCRPLHTNRLPCAVCRGRYGNEGVCRPLRTILKNKSVPPNK